MRLAFRLMSGDLLKEMLDLAKERLALLAAISARDALSSMPSPARRRTRQPIVKRADELPVAAGPQTQSASTQAKEVGKAQSTEWFEHPPPYSRGQMNTNRIKPQSVKGRTLKLVLYQEHIGDSYKSYTYDYNVEGQRDLNSYIP